jgi:acetyl-CoA acetyltransferase
MIYEHVSVAGIGITPFGTQAGRSLLDMAAVSVKEALDMAGIDLREVDAVFAGNAMGAVGAVASVAEGLGFSGIPVTRIEQACASGSTAFRLACESVTSGAATVVLALGVEKMPSGVLQLDPEPTYESRLGLDMFPLLYALKARQYMDFTGATPADLAAVAEKARRLGAMAPHAATTAPASVAEILASPMIAEPVTRLQCCRNVDGAAAVIVTARPRPRSVRVVAGVAGLCVDDPKAPMAHGWDSRERIVEQMARKLYDDSGIGPEEIDVLQLNDAFSVAEPLYLEALGFARPGEGLALSQDGRTDLGGDLPTNTDGGLIGRGHCLGATGLSMVYETCLQLLGRGGTRQVAKTVHTGLVQSHGYGGENLFLLTV